MIFFLLIFTLDYESTLRCHFPHLVLLTLVFHFLDATESTTDDYLTELAELQQHSDPKVCT